jgi:hypothetical protein
MAREGAELAREGRRQRAGSRALREFTKGSRRRRRGRDSPCRRAKPRCTTPESELEGKRTAGRFEGRDSQGIEGEGARYGQKSEQGPSRHHGRERRSGLGMSRGSSGLSCGRARGNRHGRGGGPAGAEERGYAEELDCHGKHKGELEMRHDGARPTDSLRVGTS